MASPVDKGYTGNSGQTCAAGRRTKPSWVLAQPLLKWFEIPNTALSSVAPSPTPLGISGPLSKIEAWCGIALRRATSDVYVGAAGGHTNYCGNEVNRLKLNVESPGWEQLRAPTPNASIVNPATFYLDGRPAASHTYYQQHFVEASKRLLQVCVTGIFGSIPGAADSGGGYQYLGAARSAGFDIVANDWDAPDYWGQFPSVAGDALAGLCVQHPTTGDIYHSRAGGDGFYKLDVATRTWSKVSSASRGGWYVGCSIDPTRSRMLLVGSYAGDTGPQVRDLTGAIVSVTFTGVSMATISSYPTVEYDSANDCYWVAYNDGSGVDLLRVDASTFFVDRPTVQNKPAQRTNGINNAFRYVPALGGCVLPLTYTGNVLFIRTSY